jgi:hypothetical protein
MGTKPQGRNVQPVFITGGDPLGPGVPVSVTVTPTPNPITFATQQLNVAAHATAQQLAPMPVPDGFKLVVKAKDGNTGNIYVGATQLEAEDVTQAFILKASQGLIFTLHDADEIWVASDVDGEGVTVATIAEYSGGGGGSSGGAVANRPAFATGQLNVAAHGVAQQLQAQAIPNGFTVFIRARPTNTGPVYIGNSQVNAQNPAVAIILEPGAFLTYGITNVDLVWVNADNDGDGVMWTVEV